MERDDGFLAVKKKVDWRERRRKQKKKAAQSRRKTVGLLRFAPFSFRAFISSVPVAQFECEIDIDITLCVRLVWSGRLGWEYGMACACLVVTRKLFDSWPLPFIPSRLGKWWVIYLYMILSKSLFCFTKWVQTIVLDVLDGCHKFFQNLWRFILI